GGGDGLVEQIPEVRAQGAEQGGQGTAEELGPAQGEPVETGAVPEEAHRVGVGPLALDADAEALRRRADHADPLRQLPEPLARPARRAGCSRASAGRWRGGGG